MRSKWGGGVVFFAYPVAVFLLLSSALDAQLIYREGFNDDGDGERYTMDGRGFEVNADGPAMWEHSFLVDQVGLTSTAPARRAGILWTADEDPSTWSDESLHVWDSLVAWATKDKENANIGFFASTLPFSNEMLAERFESLGHTITEIAVVEDLEGANLDLLIHTNEAAPVPPTAFADLPIPVIAFQAANHDDTLIAKIGQTITFFDEIDANVVGANTGHPALGGLTDSFPWTVEIPILGLEGIGTPAPGAKTLLTVEDPNTGDQIPALIVIEEGASLIGAFSPTPEGSGYIVGGDLNAAFGDALLPRVLELNPIDVSGKDDVKFAVKLASTDADFEAGGADDYLRVLIDVNDSGTFTVVDEFWGSPSKALASDQGNGIELSATEFTDFEYSVPAGATSLVIRFEAGSTFPNEIVAIDDVRVFSGSINEPGDFNGSGTLDAEDVDELSRAIQTGATDAIYDLNADGSVDARDRSRWINVLRGTYTGDSNLDGEFNSSDFVLVFTSGKYETGEVAGWADGDWNGDGVFSSTDFVAAFTEGGYEQGPRGAVASVPEPSALALCLIGFLAASTRGRRRSR